MYLVWWRQRDICVLFGGTVDLYLVRRVQYEICTLLGEYNARFIPCLEGTVLDLYFFGGNNATFVPYLARTMLDL